MSRTQRFTAKQIIDAIPNTGGIMALVAQKLDCDRATIWRYAKRYSTVQQALEQADEAATDMAEAKAIQLITSGYWPTIKYRLSTKGKNRGYTTRTEHSGPDGGAIAIEFQRIARMTDDELLAERNRLLAEAAGDRGSDPAAGTDAEAYESYASALDTEPRAADGGPPY